MKLEDLKSRETLSLAVKEALGSAPHGVKALDYIENYMALFIREKFEEYRAQVMGTPGLTYFQKLQGAEEFMELLLKGTKNGT